MMHLSRNILFCLLVACCTLAKAQRFGKKATLQPVTATGFYAVDISPQLSSFSTLDFADLRIADEQGRYQPYIIRTPTSRVTVAEYKTLNIVSNTISDSGKTVLLIENTLHQNISEILLTIHNAAVNRTANISGSSNGQAWFTVAENINLESRFSDSTDTYMQQLRFPLSAYQYFKIEINNGRNNSLNIIGAGMNVDSNEQKYSPVYIPNPPCEFLQKDSNNISYVYITQGASYHTGKIMLHIKGPKFFRRPVDIEAGSMLHSFSIASDTVATFFPTPFNQRHFIIKIYNGDNPPLRIAQVSTQQQAKQMVTYLEAGTNYQLLVNDSLAVKPDYDLQQFTDSFPADIKMLGIESIVDNDQPASGLPTASAWKKWLWPILIAVLAVLAMFTLRLLKDVQKKQ